MTDEGRRRHLSRSAGGVHKAHGALPDIGGLQGSDEELIVGLVDGVAALEGQHILAFRQRAAHICWAGAGEHPLWQL